MNVKSALRQALTLFQHHHENVTFEVHLLLAHTLNLSRAQLLAYPERNLTDEESSVFFACCERRLKGEPIAYILGEKEFWSMPLIVTPDVLIPRPETELLVEYCLQHFPVGTKKTVIDLGTGSGAIAIALAKERPEWQIIATDQSSAALKIARLNLMKHHIQNVSCIQANWLAPFIMKSFDIIISNPPYVDPLDIHLEQGDLVFEPRSALVADKEGLADIDAILQLAVYCLKPQGIILIEHGFDQEKAVRALFEKYGFMNSKLFYDFANKPRMTVAMI